MKKRTFSRALLAAVVMFGILALSGAVSAQGMSEEAFERVKEVQKMHTQRLLEIKGIEGTAIGLNRNARPTVKVFVSKWDVAGIPRNLDGIPVQVVVTGKFYALAKGGVPGKPPVEEPPTPDPEVPIDPTAWFERPVPIGVSTGHPAITAGTIGCRVTDGTDVYALSNNHVYANLGNAIIDDYVLQPGNHDGGTDPDDPFDPEDPIYPNDAIGTLAAFEEIVFTDSAENTIDVAIALSSTDLLDNATPSDGYGMPKSVPLEAKVGQKVKKYGRTTGLTKGRVSAVNATVDVNYGSEPSNLIARFVGQIVISPGSFSAGGDSGSLIVFDGKAKTAGDDRKPIGLLFAGSDRYTIANPISAVLDWFDELGVSIDGEE
ncbi:MAG: hypothetical protein U9R17_16540 [Thermodesulfobacteriota bacterium]|nr:hypothetical protein [Thermodesulfobacteriota bacterium]